MKLFSRFMKHFSGLMHVLRQQVDADRLLALDLLQLSNVDGECRLLLDYEIHLSLNLITHTGPPPVKVSCLSNVPTNARFSKGRLKVTGAVTIRRVFPLGDLWAACCWENASKSDSGSEDSMQRR